MGGKGGVAESLSKGGLLGPGGLLGEMCGVGCSAGVRFRCIMACWRGIWELNLTGGLMQQGTRLTVCGNLANVT